MTRNSLSHFEVSISSFSNIILAPMALSSRIRRIVSAVFRPNLLTLFVRMVSTFPNRGEFHLRREQVRIPQLGSALLVQNGQTGVLVVLKGEIAFGGGIVRVFRAQMPVWWRLSMA